MKTLIALSFLTGAAMQLCPEGAAKRMTGILCAALLLSALLAPLRELDYERLSLEQAKMSSAEAEIIEGGRESGELLQKLLLQRNCERYIESRGAALGLREMRVSVEIRRSGEGGWIPWSAEIGTDENADAERELRALIRDELGIPVERQVWTLNEE